jgi:hypothetical protein
MIICCVNFIHDIMLSANDCSPTLMVGEKEKIEVMHLVVMEAGAHWNEIKSLFVMIYFTFFYRNK